MEKLLTYGDWLNEEMMSVDWKEADHVEWEKLHMENINMLRDVLSKHKTRWWVDCGTLLGIHRDGGIISGDSDTDLGILAEDINPDVINDMSKGWDNSNAMFYNQKDVLKYCEDDNYYAIKNIKWAGLRNKNNTITKFKGKEVWADLFIYFPYKNDRFYKFADGYFRTHGNYLNTFTTFTHKGVSLKKPKMVEKYLEDIYGKGWKTPNPEYSAVDANIYGGPITSKDIGGTYKWNFVKQDYKIV